MTHTHRSGRKAPPTTRVDYIPIFEPEIIPKHDPRTARCSVCRDPAWMVFEHEHTHTVYAVCASVHCLDYTVAHLAPDAKRYKRVR